MLHQDNGTKETSAQGFERQLQTGEEEKKHQSHHSSEVFCQVIKKGRKRWEVVMKEPHDIQSLPPPDRHGDNDSRNPTGCLNFLFLGAEWEESKTKWWQLSLETVPAYICMIMGGENTKSKMDTMGIL